MKARRAYGMARMESGAHPPLLVFAAVTMECGCSTYLGNREDNGEIATSTGACSPEHHFHASEFQLRLMRSVNEDPQARPLIDVVEEMMEEVWTDD